MTGRQRSPSRSIKQHGSGPREGAGQSWDTETITGWKEFGELLRSLRSGVSLRSVARETALGHSTLSRYELGEARPGAEATEALDRYFGTGDRLTQLRNRLLLGEPQRLAAKPRCRYTTSFPAQYVGPVWISVERGGQQPYPAVHIRWGPWQRDIDDLATSADEHDRVVLCFAKGDDGLSIPIFVTTTTPVRVDFGLGDVDGENFDIAVLDANSHWARVIE